MKKLKPEQLISARKISGRVGSLGRKISEDYEGRELTLIAVSKGALVFAVELLKKISIPLKFDIISASSYRGTKKSSDFKINFHPAHELIRGRHIIIVDDILDTGKTLSALGYFIMGLSPESVEMCVLLDKSSERTVDVKCRYWGFKIPDEFVVGYGLDFDEYFRNLPYIGVIREK
ncbi:MAG: hypoxanthine phosphoribosyltransferase [Lentisphaerae bacterium GWF2_44_16]|nr:MAG: hypoxanthine phosphoribosyltransferase [Lentisphaerae bacterium GWF2_44_16]